MFKAWTLNIAGLAYVNHYVWNKIKKDFPDLELGFVTTISISAHIYEIDWENAIKKALSYNKDFVPDKLGFFNIYKRENKYYAEIYDRNKRLLGVLEDSCPERLRKTLIRRFSITTEHAAYIGSVLSE